MDNDLFSRPAPEPLPLWAAGCAACALVLAATLLHGGGSPSASSRPRPEPAAPPAGRSFVAIPLQQPLPMATTTPPRLVVKCVLGSRVSYSDLSSCRGKATQLALSGSPEVGTAAVSGREASLVASADPRLLSLAVLDVGGPGAEPATAAGRPASCVALARDIATLDTASRSGLTRHEEERVRITRQRVRAQLGSLGC